MSSGLDPVYLDLTLRDALARAGDTASDVQRRLAARISALQTEQDTFRAWADRFDDLYFTTTFSDWGADVWADDPSATTEGRSHISLNTFPAYVDIPASMQSQEAIENMVAFDDDEAKRSAAQAMERIRMAWKAEEKWQLKRMKAAVIKALYGRTASYVYYDREEKRMCADVIQNPRNLWMGYQDDDYEALEWVAQVTRMDPTTVAQKFSVDVTAVNAGTDPVSGADQIMPWVVAPGSELIEQPHIDLTFGPARIEVWDYWYRVPGKRGKVGEPTKMETYNVVIAGNAVVRGPMRYDEYEGRMPYVPLFNTFIPGTPTGRAELHDIEQLIREEMTRLTQGAQMIAKATAGDYWQLVGENPPARKPSAPVVNDVFMPGPGNRLEAIVPFVAQFQLDQHLNRIDKKKVEVSGLNDMLLGLVPVAALNSSKAITALIANYEARIAMRRELYYEWDRNTWDLGTKVWAKYDRVIARVIEKGGGGIRLDITPPSLSPRDEFETAQRAINLVQNKLWTQARGMDAVGVDDPEQEQNIMRAERTDATLWPADVQTMAQLMAALQSLGITPPANAQSQAQQQAGSGTEALRQALGGGGAGMAPGTEGSQYGTQPSPPPITGAGPSEGGGPFAQQQPGTPPPGPATATLQGMIQNGQAKGRIMTNQPLRRA